MWINRIVYCSFRKGSRHWNESVTSIRLRESAWHCNHNGIYHILLKFDRRWKIEFNFQIFWLFYVSYKIVAFFEKENYFLTSPCYIRDRLKNVSSTSNLFTSSNWNNFEVESSLNIFIKREDSWAHFTSSNNCRLYLRNKLILWSIFTTLQIVSWIPFFIDGNVIIKFPIALQRHGKLPRILTQSECLCVRRNNAPPYRKKGRHYLGKKTI